MRSTYNPNNGSFNGSNTPGGGKNSGGIPKVAFIGAGVVGLVVIGAVAAINPKPILMMISKKRLWFPPRKNQVLLQKQKRKQPEPYLP